MTSPDQEFTDMFRELQIANQKTAAAKRRLANNLDGIASARAQINYALSEITRMLSNLPESVPGLDPYHSIEWYTMLTMLQHLVSVGRASWDSADHYLSGVMSTISHDILEE